MATAIGDGVSSQEQPGGWHYLGRLEESSSGPGRLHGTVEGRYVTVVQHGGRLFCLDSICFHAGGPLGLGDLEELPGGQACLSCPWHYYLVSIDSGEKWYQGTVVGPDGKLLPGPWKSIGQRQRTHAVESRSDGGIWVQLSTEGSLASDEYAHKQECGVRLQAGHLRLNPQHLHGCNGAEGAAPRLPHSPRSASPHRSPSSPRFTGEGEDCWPEDLPQPPQHHSRHHLNPTTQP